MVALILVVGTISFIVSVRGLLRGKIRIGRYPWTKELIGTTALVYAFAQALFGLILLTAGFSSLLNLTFIAEKVWFIVFPGFFIMAIISIAAWIWG